jgi:RHS repeat-associated protein
VSFDNLTIRRKNGVVRAVKQYYPYGLEYGRFNGSFAYNALDMYNKGYTSATWHELEWKYEGLDLNYFAARYYDPIIGRWHAPDPLEQCHSPYTGMVNDPANFVDPDGRLATPLVTLASSGSFYLSTANSLVSTGMSIMGGVMSFASTCAGIVAGVRGFITTADFVSKSFGLTRSSHNFLKTPDAQFDSNFGELGSSENYSNSFGCNSDPGKKKHQQPEYVPIPKDCKKELPGFPGSKRLKHRNGSRESWGLGKGWHGEWDSERGEVEVYDRNGKHQGGYDPKTGKKREGSEKTERRPTYDSVEMRKYKMSYEPNDLVVISPEQVIQSKVQVVEQQATNSHWYDAPDCWVGNWSNPYPAPLGYITTFGTQIPPEYSAAGATVIAWILVIGTEGSMAPILYPILAP